MIKNTRIAAAVIAALSLIAGAASPAMAADADIEMLRAEIARLSERLDQLEMKRENQPVSTAKTSAVVSVPKNPESAIKFKGDFRYRYEMIDQQGLEERRRNRLRARFGISGKVNDTVTAGIQLASGDSDPISTNQSLDGGFTTKDIGIDLAYVTWQPTKQISVTAGKMKNPLYRVGGSALVWDGDLHPEGVALTYTQGRLFANLAGFYVEERPAADDSLLFAGQLGISTDIAGGLSLKTGAGYYSYSNTIGNSPFSGNAGGNTIDANGNLVNDYTNVELFAELGTDVGGMPFIFFADWVKNTEANAFDTGYAVGAKLGKASAPGSWGVSWIYQDLEPDAVIGAFSGSDFGGGGTDATGHTFGGQYSIAKNWTAVFTYFLNDANESTGPEQDYKRLQADLQFKF